ncbi:MAG: rhomboid family intramembrane serine protease [Candidatus Korarchaeota archaeon NZ13-K]|nr:MAG: rhomboid family intramembrane serine protease [Candidatus Korarchaeota archaeon NZ13-K]
MITLISSLTGIFSFLTSIILLRRYFNVPEVTSLLISLNSGVYFLTSPGLVRADESILIAYGSSGSYLVSGRYETLLTSIFLHANLLHLFLNMYALYVLGRIVEISLGRSRYSALYLLSGLSGNLLSALVDELSVGVGASGAIMGLLGYMMAMEYRFTRRLNPSTLFIAIFVIFGGFSANVDVLAHLGGFLLGLIWGLLRGR